MILKILVGFLIGFILGVAGTVFLVTSGAGNYLIAANPRVQELESKIRELEDQRTFMTRKLEDVARLTERMATRFEQLQDRFETVGRQREGTETPGTKNADGAVRAPSPEQTAPPQ